MFELKLLFDIHIKNVAPDCLHSSTGVGLIVEFENQDLENMILDDEEVIKCLRVRSIPLKGDDCCSVEQGEHVLATHNLRFKSLFFDAEVEKAQRVRHSKRVYCRCTFLIKWLNQDLEKGTFTVPSSSLMRLSTKSINIHPTIAAFLESVKSLSFSGASPFSTIFDDMDCEMDLNKLVEMQVEGIGNLVDDVYRKGIPEDTLFGGKVDTNKQMQHKTVAASTVSISHVGVPSGQNSSKRTTRSSRKLQVQMEVKEPPSSASSIQEELSEIRSHLTPLACRAALASLVSKQLELSNFHEEKGFAHASDVHAKSRNGTTAFTSIDNNISEDYLSSELGPASVKVGSKSVKTVKLPKSTRRYSSVNTGLVESYSGIPTKEMNNRNKTAEVANSSASIASSLTEIKLSQPTNRTRITRISVRKGAEIPNEYVQMKTSAEDTKLKTSTTARRMTCSAVDQEQGNKSAQTSESDSSEGNARVPKSDVSEKKSSVSKKKKPLSSLLDADINFQSKKSKKEQMSSTVETSQHSEGNGASNGGKKRRKSIPFKNQELRCSPRLKSLGRTRSQVE